MIVSILNYEEGKVYIEKVPVNITNDNLEIYLSSKYNMDSISYMCTNYLNLEVNVI